MKKTCFYRFYRILMYIDTPSPQYDILSTFPYMGPPNEQTITDMWNKPYPTGVSHWNCHDLPHCLPTEFPYFFGLLATSTQVVWRRVAFAHSWTFGRTDRLGRPLGRPIGLPTDPQKASAFLRDHWNHPKMGKVNDSWFCRAKHSANVNGTRVVKLLWCHNCCAI